LHPTPRFVPRLGGGGAGAGATCQLVCFWAWVEGGQGAKLPSHMPTSLRMEAPWCVYS
jgi:hypothetical protein